MQREWFQNISSITRLEIVCSARLVAVSAFLYINWKHLCFYLGHVARPLWRYIKVYIFIADDGGINTLGIPYWRQTIYSDVVLLWTLMWLWQHYADKRNLAVYMLTINLLVDNRKPRSLFQNSSFTDLCFNCCLAIRVLAKRDREGFTDELVSAKERIIVLSNFLYSLGYTCA